MNSDNPDPAWYGDGPIHQGVEISARLQPIPDLDLTGNIAISQNEFKEFTQFNYLWDDNWNIIGTEEISLDGNPIALLPSMIVNARATYQRSVIPAIGLKMSGHVQHVGKQYLDNSNNEDRTLDPYTVVNASVVVDVTGIPYFRGITINLWVNNLLDEEYETSGYYDDWVGANFLYPAARRNTFFSTTVHF